MTDHEKNFLAGISECLTREVVEGVCKKTGVSFETAVEYLDKRHLTVNDTVNETLEAEEPAEEPQEDVELQGHEKSDVGIDPGRADDSESAGRTRWP
jgi:hypothetical protein